LSQLEVCDLSYPALKPLIEFLVGKDQLVYARFYSAPQIDQPFKSRWEAFRSANRHVQGLSFFMGYRTQDNHEKCIDVALAVDLIMGCVRQDFDRVVVVGGDGDHLYALKKAKEMCPRLQVWLMPAQPSGALRSGGFDVKQFEAPRLRALGVCDSGRLSGVPVAHCAPPGSPDITPRFAGAFGDEVN
jgi:hypothetical protein